jgi:hypothetical protein
MAATTAAPLAASNVGPQPRVEAVQDPGTTKTTTTNTNPGRTLLAAVPKPTDLTPAAPRVFTPPAPPEQPKVEAVAATTPADEITNQQNVKRDSDNFSTRRKGGEDPFLLGGGTPGVDNSISGWGSMLKKAGIGASDGTDSPSSGTP